MTHDNHQSINKVSLTEKAQGAFLGAAVGDALGWPQEDRSSRVGTQTQTNPQVPVAVFQRWTRRAGGRYYSHEETILPGEYSDDTQLLICTARSLLHSPQWWHHLARRELPLWTLYERGGGKATKRAAEIWLAGREPWSAGEKTDRKNYYEAGGNGVAMRIMPHCLLGGAEAEFGNIARRIVADGLCTHGHPRALVGALAYGYAVWLAFRETSTLYYGAIIEKTLSEVESWSKLPDVDAIWPNWRRSAEEMNARQYGEDWQTTVAEMQRLLEQCREAMKRGALSVDQEVLTQLGCFDRRVNGAGTVAAAASIFLASRYAADPLHGLIEAAFAYGADTDTIASMTGGILGAVAGIEWLGNHVEHIQDAQFLKVLGEWLVSNGDIDRNKFGNILQTTRKDLDSLLEKLGISNPKDIISLPNGMEAEVSASQLHQARSKTIQVISRRLTTNEGQSLYIKRISRNRSKTDLNRGTLYNTLPTSRLEVDLQSVEVVKSGVQLLVRDMEKARFFYEKALGLKVEKVSRTSVNLGGNIALVSSDYKKSIVQQPKRVSSNWNSIVYLEIHPLEAAYNNVCQLGAPIQIPISQTQASGQRFFRCFDPDGNLVEIFEKLERCIERGDAETV